MDTLMEARLEFRKLLSEHGLVSLAGSEVDAVEWLEGQIIELADSISRRERFLKLVRQVREGLNREQSARPRDGDLPGGERTEKPNFYSGRRFRRINIL